MSWETIEHNRLIYFQNQFANEINNQINKVISLLTSILNIHLNLQQEFHINTSEIFLSLECQTNERFPNEFRKQIQLPSDFQSYLNKNKKIFSRVKFLFFVFSFV